MGELELLPCFQAHFKQLELEYFSRSPAGAGACALPLPSRGERQVSGRKLLSQEIHADDPGIWKYKETREAGIRLGQGLDLFGAQAWRPFTARTPNSAVYYDFSKCEHA